MLLFFRVSNGSGRHFGVFVILDFSWGLCGSKVLLKSGSDTNSRPQTCQGQLAVLIGNLALGTCHVVFWLVVSGGSRELLGSIRGLPGKAGGAESSATVD